MAELRDNPGEDPDPALGDDRTSDVFELRGGDPDEHLRTCVRLLLPHVRGRFQRLADADWATVEERVVDALRSVDGVDEVCVHHAVFIAALDVDRARWAEETRWDDARLARWLEAAERGVAALRGKVRESFLGMGLIEAVLAFHADAPAVDELLAIASIDTEERAAIRQRTSRAWRRLCVEDDRGGPFARHVAQRFITPRPPLAAWRAAHELVKTVLVLRRRHLAHEEREAHLNEAERRRTAAWKGFVFALDASSIRPRDVGAALREKCDLLCIDHRIVPARLPGQCWRDLLCGAGRSAILACEPWRAFLAANGFDAAVHAAFTAVEESVAALEERERDAEVTWGELLDVAEQSGDFGAVKIAFWGLVKRL